MKHRKLSKEDDDDTGERRRELSLQRHGTGHKTDGQRHTPTIGAGIKFITFVLLQTAQITGPCGPWPTDLVTGVLSVRARMVRLAHAVDNVRVSLSGWASRSGGSSSSSKQQAAAAVAVAVADSGDRPACVEPGNKGGKGVVLSEWNCEYQATDAR